MRLLIITSCTGQKAVTHEDALTLSDFEQGETHIKHREQELADTLTHAGEMYTGLQHVRLMRGVHAFEKQQTSTTSIDLWILSAGYGLIPRDRPVAPYECTFQGKKKAELRRWADQLNVPADVRQVLVEPYDLGVLLLGDSYLEACRFDAGVQLGGRTLVFCGKNTAKKLPELDNMRTVVLTNNEAKHFSCGLVGLKGEVTARLLEYLNADMSQLNQLTDPSADVLALLEPGEVLAPQHKSDKKPKVQKAQPIPK